MTQLGKPVPKFRFQLGRKEELVCACPAGSLLLELAGSVLSVYLPTEDTWQMVAPRWARSEWRVLHDELKVWCDRNSVILVVSSDAFVS
jgi:hypothetical protein